jgi:hypothetical protein
MGFVLVPVTKVLCEATETAISHDRWLVVVTIIVLCLLWICVISNGHLPITFSWLICNTWSVTGALPITKGNLCLLPKRVFHVVAWNCCSLAAAAAHDSVGYRSLHGQCRLCGGLSPPAVAMVGTRRAAQSPFHVSSWLFFVAKLLYILQQLFYLVSIVNFLCFKLRVLVFQGVELPSYAKTGGRGSSPPPRGIKPIGIFPVASPLHPPPLIVLFLSGLSACCKWMCHVF